MEGGWSARSRGDSVYPMAPPSSAPAPSGLTALHQAVVACRRCPRLVAWRERVAREKRAAFADQEYWGRPVPGFGDPRPRILAVGLAPAAHGANRTGRMFTGDRSGEWLYRALHRAGFSDTPESRHRGDGLKLRGLFITAAVRCAPPGNRPTPAERDRCAPFLARELALFLPRLRGVVALGSFAWGAVLGVLREAGWRLPSPRPPFGHGVEVVLPRPDVALSRSHPAPPLILLGSYHPSQQNTFTGRLTEPMFDAVWSRARELAG